MTDAPRFKKVKSDPATAHADYHGGRLVSLVFRLADWLRRRRAEVDDTCARADAEPRSSDHAEEGRQTSAPGSGAPVTSPSFVDREDRSQLQRLHEAGRKPRRIRSSAFALGALGLGLGALAVPVATTYAAAALVQMSYSAAVDASHQGNTPTSPPLHDRKTRAIEAQVRVVLFLVRCSQSLLICDDISTEHLRFADMDECTEQRLRHIQAAQKQFPNEVVMGKCRYLVGKPTA